MTKRQEEIREELIEIAKKEAMRVWRLGRRARAHGCSVKTLSEISEEGHILYTTMTVYPERLLDTDTKWKYAFR